MASSLRTQISNLVSSTLQIENQQTSSNESPAAKRLKLTLNEEKIDVFNILVQKFQSNNVDNSNLIEIINAILDFISNYDKKWTYYDAYEQNDEEILNFLLEQYTKLASKTSNRKSNVLKLKPLDLLNNEINIQMLLLKCIFKLIKPTTLVKHKSKFLNELNQTKNNKIIYELLKIIEKLLYDVDTTYGFEFKTSLLVYIKKFLKNNDHRLREICLKMLSLHYIKHDDSFNATKIIDILLIHSEDQDSRVRVAALELLILLHEKGHKIDVKYYETLKYRLSDDFDQVRLLATKLIWHLASSYPEHMVDVGTGLEVEELRLIDEAFGKICNMINDLSLEVKVQAAKILGEMNGVSSRFLMQTLDKKLMKDLKIRATQQQKTLFSSEWSSTVIATPSSDAQIQEEESISLISTGACGAFIHGLEDEYLEVRYECCNALWKLAINCPEFAAKSIDFLVDMFNDEIESVRLMSIQALTKITHYVLLTDDQIDIVLPVLEDGSFEVRESLRDLLSTCKLATRNGFKKSIQALINNYKKYQIDRYQIWKCCQNLGKNHSKFVVILVSYLLGLHSVFEMPQPDMDDPIYICCLIVIFNAAKINTTILPLLPKYVFEHYFYVRSKLPELTPIIEYIDDDFNANEFLINKTKNLNMNENEEVLEFYQNIINNLIIGNNLDNDHKIKLYESIDNDLNHLATVETTLTASCEIMNLFIKCLLIIRRQQNEPNLNKIEEALLISTKLLSLYKGYTQSEKATLYELNHYLRSLHLKQLYNLKKILNTTIVQTTNTTNMSLTFEQTVLLRRDLIKESKNYLNYLKKFKFYLKNLPKKFHDYDSYENNQIMLFDLLNSSYFNNLNVNLLILNQPKNLRKLAIEIIEPIENPETPIRYTPGLLCGIKLKAFMYNFTRFDNLYVELKYSDYEIQYIPIDLSKIRMLKQNKYSLEMDVYVSNSTWTESSYIKLCVSMLLNNDMVEDNELEDQSKHKPQYEPLNDNNNNETTTTIAKTRENFVELTKYLKVYFEPNAKKY